MKIFHVITSLGRGGAERQLVNLVSNTDRAKYEHVICHLRPPNAFAAEIEQIGCTVINLNLSHKWPWLAAPAKLAPLLRTYAPDIIQTWLYDADVSARLSRLLAGRIPIINTLHLTTYEPETIRAANWSEWKIAGLRWVDKLTAELTKPLFIACSDTVRQSAKRHLGIPESRIRVIFNSIDQTTLRCEPDAPRRLRQELGIAPAGCVFLNIGRLDPQKGQADLLRAFQSVVASIPNAYLVLVGDGPSALALRSLASELDIDRRVRFLGRRNDVGACLEMGDVFVFPSLFEGLPLAPIEAMMKGLPCIASRIGPVVEIIDDQQTGVLVTPGCVDELAAAMIGLARDPVCRRALGERAREVAVRRFDSRPSALTWERLYHEVAPQGTNYVGVSNQL